MRWVASLAICMIVSSTAAHADWGPRRDPFDPAVVRSYKAILARDPYDAGALRQLVALYRRHRTVAKLEAEYRAKLAAGEDWAALVVLARLPSDDSLALWKRAVAVKPDDARGWLAIGDAAGTDRAAASDAYQRAARIAASPRVKRVALKKLVASTRDAATIDYAYAELIALSPKDGKLWLDRGNAQLAAKQLAGAKDSFAKAERLFRTDPERRLTAMTSQGIVLEALGRIDDAIAQYERALDSVPRGYFLGQEIVFRIVDAERKRGRLGAAIERLEKRWPERRRGYFEWALLGELYEEAHLGDRAIDAYERAVAKAPTEVATQRKLIALLDKTRPTEALARHEAAARFAPGDATLQIELARRYYPMQRDKALATLSALARRLRNNVNVRSSVAALYEEWNEPQRAIGEYEAIAALEPGDADHAVLLGEAYWRAELPSKARSAWARLDTIATPAAFRRHGEVLAMHDLWDEAAAAYTKALALDPANADTLYGRARAYEALRRIPEAVGDARRAVALTGSGTLDGGLRDRSLLVRVLGKSYEDGDPSTLARTVARWRFAFERGDVAAGYLLVAHHKHIQSHQYHAVLVELVGRAPDDDSLRLALARSYTRRGEFAQAREELQRIAQRTPARAEDIGVRLAELDEEHERYERDIRWAEEDRRGTGRERPDIVGRRRRTGVRLLVGADVANASGAYVGFGIYRHHRLGRGSAIGWRLDWTRRDDDMQEHNVFAVGGVIMTRLLDARRFELAVGAGPRLELRYGGDRSKSDDAAIGGDLTVDVVPRAIPATIGVRFHHSLTEAARSSALLVELGFELR